MTEEEFCAIMLDLAAKFRRLADDIDFEYAKWLARQPRPEPPPEFCYLSREDKRRFDEVKECYERPGGYLLKLSAWGGECNRSRWRQWSRLASLSQSTRRSTLTQHTR